MATETELRIALGKLISTCYEVKQENTSEFMDYFRDKTDQARKVLEK